VIVTSSSAGRLLGMATYAPRVVEVLEDLMSIGEGLDIKQRPVEPGEVGSACTALPLGGPVVAVERGGELIRFDDPRASHVQAGDRIVYLTAGERR
jgi:voltage-gated potassium channel